MKKFQLFLSMLFMIYVMIFSAAMVSAEVLPVKNAWILHGDCIVVLRENGDLLLGNSIDAQTPKLLAQNVKEFKGKYNGSTFGENDSFKGIALHNNGDITEITYTQYGTENEKSDIKTIQANAEKIYFICDMAYINKNHELIYTYSNPVYGSSDNIIADIKKTNDTDVSYNPIYAISTGDILYKFVNDSSGKTTEKTEIMTDVKDYIIINSDLIVLRNNNDLYLIKDKEIPERIGVDVDTMSKVSYRDTWGQYDISYVNTSGEYFFGNSSPHFEKYMDNVKNAYIVSGTKYVITNDDILYSFPWQIEPNSNSVKKYAGVKDIFLTDDSYVTFKLGKNDALYTEDMRFYMSDAADVIKYDRLGTDEDRYLFIKKNGELWGAFGEQNTSFDAPGIAFITAFCQKKTVVKINQQEIELAAKIQVVNNRSMYPFRECLENMGATVLWDSVNQIAIGEYKGITIEFPIGKSEYYINGTRHEMDTKAYIDDSIGRTYIPIRYAAEGLGFTVEWNEGDLENTIDIYK